MKYILILYICAMTQPTCKQQQIINEKFETYYDCVTKGYLHSYSYLTQMYDKYDIIEQKLAIKFACRDMGIPS